MKRLSHLFPLGATYSLLHTTCQQKRLEFVRLFLFLSTFDAKQVEAVRTLGSNRGKTPNWNVVRIERGHYRNEKIGRKSKIVGI
jgi:hypothetical protein